MEKMNLFGSKENKRIDNLIVDNVEEIKQVIYETPDNGHQYTPTVALFNKDKGLLLAYINEESYYPTLYKVTRCCKTEDRKSYYVEVEFIEDFTDKLLGNEMFALLVAKEFNPKDILKFKVSLLKLRCLNETKNLMKNLNEQVERIEEGFAELSPLASTGLVGVAMYEMSNAMDRYREDIERGYFEDMKSVADDILTEKYR